jgi:hypothetical protein
VQVVAGAPLFALERENVPPRGARPWNDSRARGAACRPADRAADRSRGGDAAARAGGARAVGGELQRQQLFTSKFVSAVVDDAHSEARRARVAELQASVQR